MRVNPIVRLAAISLFAAACSSPEQICPLVGVFGLNVAVVDSLSGAPAGAGATLLSYDLTLGGQRIDSVVGVADEAPLQGAFERAGQYTVVVRQSGYRDWVRSPVAVKGDACGVQPTRLTARLAKP